MHLRKTSILLLSFILFSCVQIFAFPKLPKEVRGFCIAAPQYNDVETFIQFIDNELATRKVNVLILRIDYNYQYTSHPELVTTQKRLGDNNNIAALSLTEMKKIVAACKKHNIILVPQVNLFGHQSWATTTSPLLKKYPQFDETPWVRMPENYKWPNADELYCKSYCPLHPEVHKIVFELVDEIMEVCETKHFHAGMDEVFYIGMNGCTRCAGLDRSKLFADEVNKINDHVNAKDGRLWIWGDRMIDGQETKLGMWEGSTNDTYRSIDMINKNVVINDWHYESSPKTAEMFAKKGFDVMMCPWRKADIAKQQVADYNAFKASSSGKAKKHYRGFIQTVWTSADNFLQYLNGTKKEEKFSTVECFKTLMSELNDN
ncbi:MAG: family 20 glycosylhydrolase [Chitinophagaceae bacterium]